MIPNIQTALDAILGSVVAMRKANGAGRIFELFIMTGVAVRLKTLGCEVWLQRSDGSRINPNDSDRRFIQRAGAPSGVPKAADGPNNPSVVAFRKIASGPVWEIWNGVQFTGRSGALHEIDIAVVPQEVGNELRRGTNWPTSYPVGRPRVAVECKDVGLPGTPDETRAFVARLYDLTILRAHQKYLGFPPPGQVIYPGNLSGRRFHTALQIYWQENRRTFDAIARRTGFSTGTAGMTRYYDIEPHGSITATSVQGNDFMDAIATWIVKHCS